MAKRLFTLATLLVFTTALRAAVEAKPVNFTPIPASSVPKNVRSHGVPLTANRLRLLTLLRKSVFARSPMSIMAATPYVRQTFDFRVIPYNAEPYDTDTTNTQWLGHLGCLTNAYVTVYNPNGTVSPSSYTDPACLTGDPADGGSESQNWGFLMNKTGPTSNFAAAQAIFTPPNGNINANFPNAPLTELGYDLRVGSHCGAAPYIITQDAGPPGNPNGGAITYYGCNTSTVTASTNPEPNSGGWERRRFTITDTNPIIAMVIIMDEGTDLGGGPPPPMFSSYTGHDIMDNFDINGRIRGRP